MAKPAVAKRPGTACGVINLQGAHGHAAAGRLWPFPPPRQQQPIRNGAFTMDSAHQAPIAVTHSGGGRRPYLLTLTNDLATGLYVPGGSATYPLSGPLLHALDQTVWRCLTPADRVHTLQVRIRSLGHAASPNEHDAAVTALGRWLDEEGRCSRATA